ncbi:hypothetical protein [Larkinella soli]|uniref:hypothetical protein n=1 Tax=Larkinella soli TaxID=1770527 RepID=UPI000FFC5B14|nr:hypothetical protein [Larkinella soli]
MNAIEIHDQSDRYIISLDKSVIEKEQLIEVLERLQLERLAKKVDIDDSILALAEEINAGWWQQNKHRFIRE